MFRFKCFYRLYFLFPIKWGFRWLKRSYQTWSPPAWRQPWQIWRSANSKWRQRPSRHPCPSLPQSCCPLPSICPHNCHPPPKTSTVTDLWPLFCGSYSPAWFFSATHFLLWPNYSPAWFTIAFKSCIITIILTELLLICLCPYSITICNNSSEIYSHIAWKSGCGGGCAKNYPSPKCFMC